MRSDSRMRFPVPRMLSWIGLTLGLIAHTPALAYTITPVGTSGGTPGGQTLYEVSGLVEGDFVELAWNLDGSGSYAGSYPDLAASAVLGVTTLSDTRVVLDITLSNDTMPAGDLRAVITVFGFQVLGVDLGNPLNRLSSAGSYFDTYDEGNIAGGLAIDVCASTDGACNHGEPRYGIRIGESDSFQFTLYGDFDTSNLTLANFGTKWQTNFASPEGDTLSFEIPGMPTPPIPEPYTATLMGLGLVGLGVVGRKRTSR